MASQKTALQSYLANFSQKRNPNKSTGLLSTSTNPETWSSEFPNAKSECVDQLIKIKQKIKREEEFIRSHIDEYHDLVIRQLDQQYQVLKTQVLKQLDKTYEENKIRVKAGFGRQDMEQLNGVIGGLQALSLRIQDLLIELEAKTTYKKGIADTVTQDFQNKRRILVTNVRQAITRYQSNSILKVQPQMFQKLKYDINNLFNYRKNISRGDVFREVPQVPRTQTFYQDQKFNSILKPPNSQLFPSNVPINRNIQNFQNQISSYPEDIRQPFSFQPSRATENELRSNPNQPNSPSKNVQLLRQSSAQQFNNAFARQFQNQYNPVNMAKSQVQPFSKQKTIIQVSQLNPHRNRDLLKRSM